MSAAPPEGGRPRRELLWSLVPYAVFAALCALTWKRWFLPFQDHPREVMTALRLADGERLYRDVGYLYGPLPAHLDALALRLLGRHLDVLLGLRMAVALLGIAALARLARRLVPDRAAASAVVAALVATCGFCYGGPWTFPYSIAALEGLVGAFWALELALASEGAGTSLAAGLLAGLAAGTKVELLPLAVLAPLPALACRRPRREAAAATLVALVLAALALGGPVALRGADVVRRHGYLIALRDPEPFRRVQRGILLGGHSLRSFLTGGLLDLFFPSLLFVGAAALVLRARRLPAVAGAGAAFAVGLAAALVPANGAWHLLLPLAGVLSLGALVRFARSPRGAPLAPACIGLVALLFLWRQPFFLRIGVYTSFSAPLALLVALAALARGAVPARAVALCAGIAFSQGIDRWKDFHRFPERRVAFARGAFFLPRDAATLLEGSVAAARRLTPPGGTVWAWTEPGFVAFFAERRSAFVDEQFYPGLQDARSEDEMIARLEARPPGVVVITNREVPEYGAGGFGHGVLDRFAAALRARMRPAGLVGAPRPIPGMGMATQALVLVPAPRR